MPEYPEHEKLKAIPEDVRQAVGDWLESVVIAAWGCPHGVTTRITEDTVRTHGDSIGAWDCDEGWCRMGANPDRLWSIRKSTQDHLADMFDIDYKALMDEKEAMLDAMRESASTCGMCGGTSYELCDDHAAAEEATWD